MKNILLFIFTFIFILLIYEIFIVKKALKDKRKKPLEVKYLINRYNIKLKNINYNELLHVIAVVSSFDIAIVIFISNFIDSYLLMLVIALVLVLLLILISYDIIGRIYRKK